MLSRPYQSKFFSSAKSGLSKSISRTVVDGHDDAGHDIDEKQPVPRIGVGQIAADRRPDGRRQRRDQADDRRDEFLPRALEDQIGRGEHRRHHAAADKALDRPPHDHAVDRGAGAAHDAGEREAGGRNRKQDAGAERARQKAGQRNRDHLGDQIGRLHPGNFIGRCRQAGLDVVERRRHDLDVEKRHEHAEAHGEEGDQPARRDRHRRACGAGADARRKPRGRCG